MSRLQQLIGGLAALTIVGCSGEAGPNISGIPSTNIAEVRVAPKVDTIFVSDTVRATDILQMQGAVIGRNGAVIANAPLAWTSLDPAVAVVDSGGHVIPTGFGTARIVGSAAKADTARITVMPATQRVIIAGKTTTITVDDPITPADSAVFSAVALSAQNDTVTGARFQWTTSNASVATVGPSGVVHAIAVGTVTITARNASSSQNGSQVVVVRSVVKQINTTASPTSALVKDSVQLTATAIGQDGAALAGRTFAWTSSNPSVATVDQSGRAVFLSAGSATFSARSGFVNSAAVTVNALDRRLGVVSAGSDASCGIAALGRVWCWGLDDKSQLGTASDSLCFEAAGGPTFQCVIQPKQIATVGGSALEFAQVSVGTGFGCGVTTDGSVYCWGDGVIGQIGNGKAAPATAPSLATVRGMRFTNVSAGGAHACAIATDRSAWCWGADGSGQLGEETLLDHSTTPIPVSGSIQFSAISAGAHHTCGLDMTGHAYCWGDNTNGQLGDGSFSFSPSLTPTAVGGGKTFTSIATSGATDEGVTCAVGTDHKVYCWGAGTKGQIGDGASVDRPVPTAVAGAGTYSSVSVGGSHVCAVSSGGIDCWGTYALGVHADVAISATPVQVVAGNFSSVTSGQRHSCAASTTGVSCWGSNVFGALGDGVQALFRNNAQAIGALR